MELDHIKQYFFRKSLVTYSFKKIQEDNMKYGIIGTGAIGGYYGAKLAKANKDVHFLLNSDYSYVKGHGLRVDSVKGDFTLNPIQAYHQACEMPKCDVVFVCLKTTNNDLLRDILPPIVNDNTTVILIQNGIGAEADLQNEFPNLRIAGGLAFICARKTALGHIEHLDEGRLNIGSFSEPNKLKLLEIANDLEEAGIDVEIVDLSKARWEKLVWNIPFNGLSVVMDASTDQLLANEHTQQLIYDIMQEVILAANYCEVPLLPKLADQMLETTTQMIPYSPSMKLDYENKREMEILYIYTKPLTQAILAGVEMPRVEMLAKQLHYIQSKYR